MALNTNLGTENIGKLLVKLSIPAIVAQLINALYNIVDRIYISRIEDVGEVALTGVGVTYPIIMVISAFSVLIGLGGAPRMAIMLGEQNTQGAKKIIANCFVMFLVSSTLLTITFLTFREPLLMAFGASENTIGYATDYLDIYLLGTIFAQLSLGLNYFITAQGFAKISMLTILIGAVINIILDPIMIFHFDLGVQGAAIATVISQCVSAIWTTSFLFSKRPRVSIEAKYMRLEWPIITSVLALGISPFIMNGTESLVNITLNSSLQKYHGDEAVNAMTIIGSVVQFSLMPLSGLVSSAQPITSYNFGAKNMDRVRTTFKYLVITAISYSVFIWTMLQTFPHIFINLFIDDASSSSMELTMWALRIFSRGIIFIGVQFSCQQTFIALGQAKTSLILALTRKVFLLIPLALILPHFFENKIYGVFLAQPIADILATSITGTIFFLQFNKILEKRMTL